MKIWPIILSFLITSQALAIENLTDKTFYKKVTCSSGWVLVDFYTTWCPACKKVHPLVLDLEKKYKGVKFYQMDTEESPDTSSYFRIRYIPTLLLFKDGGSPIEIQTSSKESVMGKQIDDAMKEK